MKKEGFTRRREGANGREKKIHQKRMSWFAKARALQKLDLVALLRERPVLE